MLLTLFSQAFQDVWFYINSVSKITKYTKICTKKWNKQKHACALKNLLCLWNLVYGMLFSEIFSIAGLRDFELQDYVSEILFMRLCRQDFV